MSARYADPRLPLASGSRARAAHPRGMTTKILGEPGSSDRPPASERRAAAEPELLDDVVFALGQRHRVVEAQRAERGGPDQADADRGADDLAVVEIGRAHV